jgi:16S rRNA (cytosine1402-N4)-methyltransferase
MSHKPILLHEIQNVIEKYNIQTAIDVTFGGGNHAKLFPYLEFAMDRDIEAQKYNTFGANLIIDKFSNLSKYIAKPVDVIHADLGLSWMQIQSNRGFSFMTNSELHMTASQEDVSLYKTINHMSKNEITKILSEYGELKNAKAIAQNIVEYQLYKDIHTTYELIEACKINNYSILAKIFQAFRIYVNDEINELHAMLNTAIDFAKYISIITFHSIEAKIVKEFMASKGYKVVRIMPSKEEIAINPASRSALLYICFKPAEKPTKTTKKRKSKFN